MAEYIDHLGIERRLGNIVPPAGLTKMWPVYGTVPDAPLVDESEWDRYCTDPFAENDRLPYIHDQDGIGQCLTEDTEVLTDRGWIAWPDCRGSDLLGTVNPDTGCLEFQLPIKRHVFEYEGEMVYSTNRRIDFGVTPDHRMYVRKWDESRRTLSDRYTFQLARDIGWYAGLMPAPSGFVGTELNRVTVEGDREYDGDDFIALLALVTSDGFAGGSDGNRNHVSFCNFRPSRQRMVAELAARTGFREVPSRPGVWYRTDAGALANWVRVNCYTNPSLGALNKKVPEIVKWTTCRQMERFLEFFGDRNHGRDADVRFYSSSRRMVDDLQEILLRLGKRSTICKNHPRGVGKVIGGHTVKTQADGYTLCVAEENRLCIDRKKHIERDRYKGLVYCATVPNGTLVTRRNGSVLISGNCNADATAAAVEYCRKVSGLPDEKLCAGDLYHRINGGADNGSLLEDALAEMLRNGIGRQIDCGNTNLWKGSFHPATVAQRAPYKVLEAWICPTFKHCFSAVIKGFAIISGIMWPGSDRLDSEGWLPLGSPAGGHAIFGHTPAKHSSGKYGIGHNNSWTPGWGRNGQFVIGQEHYRGAIGGWWAVRVAVTEQTDVPAPKN